MAIVNRGQDQKLGLWTREFELQAPTLGPCGQLLYHYPLGFSIIKMGRNRVSTFQSSTNPLYRETVNSVSSPGFYSKKMVRVKWFPKKYHLSPPTRPHYNPPQLRKEPKWGVPKSASDKRKLKLRKIDYEKKLDQSKTRRQQYNAAYDAKMIKYSKRLAKFEEYTRLKMEGVLKYRLRKTRVSAPQMNAYSRTRTWDTGVIGEVTILNNKFAYTTCGTGSDKVIHYFTFQANYNGIPTFGKLLTGSFGWGAPHTQGSFPQAAAVLQAAESQAIANLHSNLKDATVHIGNMLAERRQTMELLTSIVRGVAKALKAKQTLAQGLKSLIGDSKTAADNTLAFQFGVRPLLNDAYSAGKALARFTTGSDDVFTVKSTGTSNDTQADQVSYTYNPNWNAYTDGNIERRVEQTVKVSYALVYRVSNGTTQTLSQLGLINPAEIAWEILPWSFAIDWFLPIGNYISSLTSEAGVTFVSGTKTVTTTTTYRTRAKYKLPAMWLRAFSGDVEGLKIVETKVRTVLSAAPTQQLPSFKNPFSVNHLVDAIALARQRFR